MQSQSFNKHLGCTYYVSDTKLDAGDIEARKTDKNLWVSLAPKDTEKDKKQPQKADL